MSVWKLCHAVTTMRITGLDKLRASEPCKSHEPLIKIKWKQIKLQIYRLGIEQSLYWLGLGLSAV